IVSLSAANTTVASGGTVALTASVASGIAPFAFAWQPPAAGQGTLIGNGTTATFQAPNLAAGAAALPVTLRVTVTGANGVSSSASVVVTVNPPQAPTVVISSGGVATSAISVFSGTGVNLTASCTMNGVPAACTFNWAQTNFGFPNVPRINATGTATGATLAFTPSLAVGGPSQVVQIQATATLAGATSAPASIAVTVNPRPDNVIVTNAEYRIGKQRLILSATSDVISANVVLTLQPYTSTAGNVVVPGAVGIFLNNGGGLYTLDLVGFPQPATPLVVTSNLG